MIIKRIKYLVAALVISPLVAASPVGAAPCADSSLFLIPSWHNGLPKEQLASGCSIKAPNRDDNGLASFIWTIALNIVQAFFVIAGYAAVIFIILGGFRYIISAGMPDKMGAAKKAITNAIIGLVIALLASAAVGAIQAAIRS